jgi:pilus assembly protein CpaC
MKTQFKIAGALLGVAFLGGVIVAAAADGSVDYNTGPIWIADAPAPAPVPAPKAAAQVASIDATFTPSLPDAGKPTTPAPQLAAPQTIVPPVVAPSPTLDMPVAPPQQQAQTMPVAPPATRIQTPPVVAAPAQAPAPVTQATFTGTSGKELSIQINRGALVRLPVPADTVFVANPEIADIQVKSPRLIYVFAKRAGETVLYAVDGNDNLLLNTRIVVTHNLQALRTAIGSVVPGGGVSITTAGDALVLGGSVSSAAQAEDLRRLAARFAPGDGAVVSNLHVVAPNQINLRVRIAEVSRDTLKQFGINWQNAIKLGGFVFGLAQGAPVLGTGGGFNVGNNGTNSIVGSFRKGNVDLNAVIDALANENLITVLAEPNLTAMSGETANFLAGGEFPIPVPQSGNGNAITVEFKKFGVSLAFTPTVIDGNRINLKVRPEVSQLSTVGSILINSISIPALTTRNAETTVELASGQSFAIAGLLQHNSQQDASKTPFLGDIPILGALFKSDRYQRNETELVIVVTPYLVKPVSANAIATPVDGLTPPTDAQRIFYGTKNQQKIPEAGNAPRGRDGNTVIGPAGFQLD